MTPDERETCSHRLVILLLGDSALLRHEQFNGRWIALASVLVFLALLIDHCVSPLKCNLAFDFVIYTQRGDYYENKLSEEERPKCQFAYAGLL